MADDVVQNGSEHGSETGVEADRLAPLRERTVPGGYVSVPDGWVDLVVALDRKIETINPDYRIFQVKEKFGGLRYYVESIDIDVADIVDDLIAMAEFKAVATCQVCAKPGEPSTHNGWAATLCEEHRENK